MSRPQQYAPPTLQSYGTLEDIERETALALRNLEDAAAGPEREELERSASRWVQLLEVARHLAAMASTGRNSCG